MNIRMSRRTVLVLSTLATSALALVVQPAATFARPSLAHKSMTWSGTQARRDGNAFFPEPRLGSFAVAPRSRNEGTCDAGDAPKDILKKPRPILRRPAPPRSEHATSAQYWGIGDAKFLKERYEWARHAVAAGVGQGCAA